MIWNKWKKQVVCILAGILLYLAVEYSGAAGGDVENYLTRNSYGGGEASYHLWVDGLFVEKVPLEVHLEERRYTREKAEAIFDNIQNQIMEVILDDNSSLKEVRSNLNLISSIPDTGIRLRWTSDRPDILDAFGFIYDSALEEQGQEVSLLVEMSDGIYESQQIYVVKVFSPILTEEEEAVAALKGAISKLDKDSLTEEGLWLPKEYEGKKLHYRDADGSDNKILLVLGFLLAGLCYAKDISDKKEAVKIRNSQLMLDYAEIVSKLMVFFGAGMTIFSAWERIVLDYEKSSDVKKGKKRCSYEEMCISYYQIKSGTSEGKAYVDFGRRCSLQPYRKLASLLEQNRKSGMKNLRNLMQVEMTDAFEQRKNTAKRLGEEASTKLLIPLFFTLGIVMVMIVMPAFLSFY